MPRIEAYSDAPALTGAEYVPISVLIGGQYVTRRATVQSIANKAPASGGGGGGSDFRDAVRAWLPPYNVSPASTPADNVIGINSAITAAGTGGGTAAGSSRVLLPQGTILINSPIIVKTGVALVGQGSGDPATVGGTELRLADGSIGNVIQDSHWNDHLDFWDHGEISNLRINGNKANCPNGTNGIGIYAMGEESRIRNVNIRNVKQFGINFPGDSLTALVENVTCINCGSALHVAANDGLFIFRNVRAENSSLAGNFANASLASVNNGTLITIENGATAYVSVENCRVDAHGNAIEAVNFSGCICVRGGYFRLPAGAAPATFYNISLSVNMWSLPLGAVIAGYTNFFYDHVSQYGYPMTGTNLTAAEPWYTNKNIIRCFPNQMFAWDVFVKGIPIVGIQAPNTPGGTYFGNGTMLALNGSGGIGTTVYARTSSGQWYAIG